jgi:hypothetical protein
MAATFHMEASCRPLFADHGLLSFHSLMHQAPGTSVGSAHDRLALQRLSLSGADGPKVFYLKRACREPILPLLKSLFFGRLPHSGPVREKNLLLALRQAGFATMTPVAWGEERRWGLPTSGFLLVREVRGPDGATLFSNSTAPERHALLERIGGLVGRLHGRGFFHPVRLKDLIQETSTRQLVLIDRETSKPWATRFSQSRALTALARAARRTLRDGHRFSPADIRTFLRGYAGGVAETWKVQSRELRRLLFSRIRRDLRPRAGSP